MARWLCCLVLCTPIVAQAYCPEPSFPIYTPNPPSKPDEPYCVIWKNCTEWDVRIYKQELESWADDLQRYVNEAQEVAREYAENALEFARCELRR